MIFNIKDFGAKGDNKTLNTKALQDAIDACNEAGGGVVLCEPGIYVTGSFELKSNVELHLSAGCKILGSSDINDYRDLICRGFKHENAAEGVASYLVGASYAENIAITGSGEINASGPTFYDHSKMRTSGGKFSERPKKRPRLLMLYKCTDVRITEASFMDSPCWTFWLMLCERVNIHRIKITGDQRMINNDGIDVDACRNVTISDSYINTDDDCIVIRAIQQVHEEEAICENVTVNNCILESTCQCIRISCPSDHITRDCTFTNLIIKGRTGIKLDHRLWYVHEEGSKADVSNMLFSNIVIDCREHSITMFLEEGTEIKQIKGISFSDIRIKSVLPIFLQGNDKTYLEDISFNNITLDCKAKEAVTFKNCKRIKLNNVEINNVNSEV